MSLSNITNVNHTELNIWNASGKSILHEHLDNLARSEIRIDQSRSHDPTRIDDGQAKLLVLGQTVNIVPSGALSQRLRFLVGGDLIVIGITPVGLIEDIRPLFRRQLDDRRDTGGHGDSLHSMFCTSTHYRESAVNSGSDELVLVSGLFNHEWRCEVKNICRALNSTLN